MTELSQTLPPDLGLPLVEFDGPEAGDLAMAPAAFQRDAVENNFWWTRERRISENIGATIADVSTRLYGSATGYLDRLPDLPAQGSEVVQTAMGPQVRATGTKESATDRQARAIEALFADLDRLRTTTPGDFANFPTSMDDLKARAEAQARVELKDELEDANNTLGNRSDPTFLGGLAAFGGSMGAAVADVEGLAMLPLGGGSGSLARTMLIESLLGGAGALVQIPAQQRQAEFLGTDAPDPVLQVLSGFAFGGALPLAGRTIRMGANTLTPAGRIENRELLRWGARDGATEAERGATAALGREEATLDTAPDGVNADEHAARVDAAERDLEDDMVRPDDVIPDVGGKRPEFDWDKHRSQGGLREDAITGLEPEFRTSLEDMILSAPPHIRDGLSVFSGYRSIERQQELWDASDKSGKMVARPGHSKHNHGQAVDLEWHGERLDRAPAEVQNWVAANLEKFGLTRPMDYEPWHVEPVGARGGKAAGPTIPRPVIEDGLVPPEEWAPISNGIFAGESGGDWDALFAYSNRPGGPFEDVKLTEMTVDEALAFSDPSGPYGQWVARNRPDPQNGVATPMGAYQIVHTTLQAAKDGLGLTGDELMTPELQERLGQWIYLEQGTGAWQGYRGPRDSFSPRGPGRYTGGGMVPLGEDAAAAGLFSFDPRTLGVDATTYQFKMGGDEFGVTGRLAGERTWDPNAGIGIMAHERLDGSLWVVDGHQRSGLARKLMSEGHAPITLTGTLYRESDGFTAEMVRAMAAMKNIRQESGSPLDAAKVLRDDPSLMASMGSRSRPFMLQAQGLADLEPGPFQAVVNEVIPQNYGAIVGRVIPGDEKLQGVAIATLAKAKPANETQAESIIRDIRRLGLEKRADEAQLDMFGGGFKLSDTVISERARVIDRIMKDARADRALFNRLERQAEIIQEAGNVLNRSENATRAELADQILARFLILAEQDGPVRDAIDAAARSLRAGAKLEDTAADVFALLGRRADEDANRGLADGATGGGGQGEDLSGDIGPLSPERRAELADRMQADPAYTDAMARQAEIPPTSLRPDYGTDAFWQQRSYRAPDGREIAGLPAVVDHLTEVSRRLAWVEDGLPPEPIRRERQAVILIGPPAAGKSSIANPLARSRGAAILDADEAKKLIPEYGKGEGANAVHEESGEIADRVMTALMQKGENLVLPKVGDRAKSIEAQILRLKDAGYRVDLVEVVAPAEVAIGRMMDRGRSTGRFIPKDVMLGGIDGAPRTYQLLKEKGAADGYARIDNAPDRGQPRGVIEDSAEILHAFRRGDGSDRAAADRGGPQSADRGRGDQAEGLNGPLPSPRLTELPPDGGGRLAPGLFDDPLEDAAETARLEGLERDLFAALNDPTFDLPLPAENGGTTSLRAFAEAAREETDFVDALKTLCLTKGARP